MAKGDQIYVYRPYLNLQGIYEHHGIDYGDGTVIHYRKTNETVSRTPLLTFSHGLKVYLKPYQQTFCFLPDTVIHRAESRLGEQKYNFLFNNCEHFASWCKTGMSVSHQVKDFFPFLSKLDTQKLYQPLHQSLQTTDHQNAQRLLNEALGQIRVLWDDFQPQYKTFVEETQTWEKVAQTALQRQREDLAKRAIEKKLQAQKKARAIEQQLKQLADMTETLIKNSQTV